MKTIFTGVEITGPEKRTISGNVIELFFTAGMILLGFVAYLVRNWQHLNLIVSLPGFVFMAGYW